MALTVRQNGTGASNLITAQWFNDYHDLLTGAMSDQWVSIGSGLTLNDYNDGATTAPTLAATSGTALGIGTYQYRVAFGAGDGIGALSTAVSVTTTSGKQAVVVSNLPIGTESNTIRYIYRTTAGGSDWNIATIIHDNTTTSWTDTVPDGSLGAASLPHSSLGGSLIIKQGGTTTATIYKGGAVMFDSGNFTSDGSGNVGIGGTLTVTGGSHLAATNVNGLLTWVNTLSTSNKIMDLEQGYGLFSDNAGTYGTTRLWYDGPDRGELTIGPRTGANYFEWVRSRATRISFDIGHNASTNSDLFEIILSGTTAFFINTFGINSKLDHYFTNALRMIGGQQLILNDTAVNGETTGSLFIDATAGGTSSADLKIHNGSQGYIVLDSAAKHISFRDGSNNEYGSVYDNGTLTIFGSARANGAIGFRNGNLQLAELKGTGNMVLRGTTYYTNTSSAGYAANGTFDSFDFSECYQTDAEYPVGTIVCPKDITTPIAYDGTPQSALPILTQCTHDACALAGIVVSVPGFCAGMPNVPSMNDEYDSTQPMKQPVAQVGRVFAKTAYDIAGGSYVCSDGRGGVRAMATGDKGMALGVALSPTVSGMVPVLVRPTFVVL